MPLSPGHILNKRYRIVKLLCQGGFGAVYRAWDIVLKIPIGLKVNYSTSPSSQSQFLREASLLANLNHPNLPRVTDHFVIVGQGQYLVMDYIEGEDLQTMLDRCAAPLVEAQVLPWIAQICDALTYMHTQVEPVIHRDIKPANIKITPEGRAVLVDFGIAKIYTPNKRTPGGARAASPGYAPFEQYGQAPTDARTDVYALGATLYALLTCQPPTESIARMAGTDLPMPRALNPVITPATEQVVLRALAVMPDQRYPSAADFKAALFPIVKLPPVVTAKLPTQSKAPKSRPALRLNISWGMGLGVLGVLLLIVAFYISNLLIGRDESNRTATQTALVLANRPTRTHTPRPTSLPLTSTPAPVFPNNPVLSPSVFPTTLTPTVPSTSTPGLDSTQISDQDGMVLVYIPASTFTMGSFNLDKDARSDEKPAHTVYLDAFWIDLTEVTNAMFAKFVAAMNFKTDAEKGGWGFTWTGSTWVQVNGADWRHPFGLGSDIRGMEQPPVVQVSWNDARAYCDWAGGRLPSEAQWEKAARGPDGRMYPWGNQPLAGNLLNFADRNLNVDWADKSINDGYEFIAPVGSYPAGASYYGVLDMAGNVWEWVADWYDETYYAKSPDANPTGPLSGEYRVLRGGSWRNLASNVRVAIRSGNLPEFRLVTLGFRCVR